MDPTEPTSSLPGESPFGPQQLPRLSILHLMLWMLCSAVYLTLLRAIFSVQSAPAEFVPIQQASSVLYGCVTGAALAGAIALVQARLQFGLRLARQPGHWFLLATAIVAASTIVYFAGVTLLGPERNARVGLLFYCPIFLLASVIYAFAARSTRSVGWRFLFVLLVALELFRTAVYFGNWAQWHRYEVWSWLMAGSGWGTYLAGVWVVVLSYADVVQRRSRDWLHWTGVITYLAAIGASLLLNLGIWLMR